MGAVGTCIVVLLAFVCIVRPLYATCNPGEETAYPKVAEIDVSEIFLFNLVKGVDGYLSSENVQTVFQRIVTRHHISPEKIDFTGNCLTSLKSKLSRLWNLWKSRKGSCGRLKLLTKFEKTIYTLKVPHKTGSPTKRKLEHELENEIVKRRKVEDSLIKISNDLVKCQEEKREVERKLERFSNPQKRERGERGKSKGKLSFMYSERQKRRHRRQKVKDAKDLLGERKFLSVEFTDEDGHIVKVVENEQVHVLNSPNQVSDEEIDELIFIMDSFNVTQNGYHEIAQRYSSLPRACRIAKRRGELNNLFEIKTLEGEYSGVYKSLKDHLVGLLSDETNSYFIQNGQVKIKLSGDGTRAGSKKHLINMSYTVIGDKNCMSDRGNYLLAIVQCPETGECIYKALRNLIDEFNSLEFVEINGKFVEVVKFVGGDLKFLNQVTGIGGFASTFSCLWCKCSKVERSDVTKKWSMTDTSQGARTVEEITRCAKMPKNSKNKFNCNAKPIFSSVPIARVIPDTLHLFLRIMDQLVYQLTYHLQHLDNCVRLNPNLNLDKCTNLMRFQNFVIKLGITDWKYLVDDGKVHARSFTGPEHRKILFNIDLKEIIPDHPKLSSIQTLWSMFKEIVSLLNRNLEASEIDRFESSTRRWLEIYQTVYLAKDITPYMHVLTYHVPEVMRKHGNIALFCQQGLEKLNDHVTKWYFRSTNFGKAALKQIMEKQSRLRLLEARCKRSPKWAVKCSICHQSHHNRATCPQKGQ